MTSYNYSPTVFAPPSQSNDFLSKDLDPVRHDIFGNMLGNLRQYNEIEDEEKKVLACKIDELKNQLNRYKRQKVERVSSGQITNEEKRSLSILQNESKTLKYQIKTLENDKENIIKESNLFKLQIQNLKKEKFDKITEVTNLKVEIRQLEVFIKEKLELKLRNYRKLISTLKLENEVLVNKNKMIEKKLEELAQFNTQLLQNNSELQQENDLLQKRLVENLEKLKNMTLENDKLKHHSHTNKNFSQHPIINQNSKKVPESRRHQVREELNNNRKPTIIPPQQIRFHQQQQKRSLPSSPIDFKDISMTTEEEIPSITTTLTVRIIGKQSMLKQCGFKFKLSEEDLEDTRFLFEKVCNKYCEKFGLSIGNLQFTNYKGDKLSISAGHHIDNGDIIYVNYK